MSPERIMTAEEQKALEEASDFVGNNIVPVSIGRKCVDGRYLPQDENTGMLARPGGDFGYVMVLLTLNKEKRLGLSIEDCVNRVYLAVTYRRGEHFNMHTDSHAQENQALSGCGHIAKATDPDIQSALDYANQLSSIRTVTLQGDHQEKGVLVIKGTSQTVRSQGGEDMYFVYDQTRDEEYMRQLVSQLGIANLTVDEFIDTSREQLEFTLKQLALSKPIFEVNADNPQPQVDYAGKVS